MAARKRRGVRRRRCSRCGKLRRRRADTNRLRAMHAYWGVIAGWPVCYVCMRDPEVQVLVEDRRVG